MRLFIAIKLSNRNCDFLQSYQQKMSQNGVIGRFSPRENFHITLAFLGERDGIDEVSAVLRKVARKHNPFNLENGYISSFSFRTNTTLILRLKKSNELEALVSDIRSALLKQQIYFDSKPFHSHITLVRRACYSNKALPSFDYPLNQHVESFVLFSSTLTQGKDPIYTPLMEFKLNYDN